VAAGQLHDNGKFRPASESQSQAFVSVDSSAYSKSFGPACYYVGRGELPTTAHLHGFLAASKRSNFGGTELPVGSLKHLRSFAFGIEVGGKPSADLP
jgi:hypothetical protein